MFRKQIKFVIICHKIKVELARAKMAKAKTDLVKADAALKEELNNRMKNVMAKCD